VKIGAIATSTAAIALALAGDAAAFCGFYVDGAGSQMFADATHVVLMRDGTRTVLSMQNNYKGPPDAFAMVIPVPVVLKETDVKTLPRDVFERVDKMGAPRLVEYWEQDPCTGWGTIGTGRYGTIGKGSGTGSGYGVGAKRDLGVTVEATFEVGEYQIVILSAKDSSGLDTWLRQEGYKIPPGAAPFLAPYVSAGMKFFVAKVDPKKVTFEDGRAMLSPLRFHYDSDEFSLPIRLGLANSGGTQDLIVSILAASRYEVANYENVTIPTNLDVRDTVRERFGEFYVALFDATVKKNPGAVVTEYAWQATNCDPCPGPPLGWSDFATLGADVAFGAMKDGGGRVRVRQQQLTLTRLHARYGTSITEDLIFKAAEPIVGGREVRDDRGRLEKRSQKSRFNNFQARYAIRHWWTGAIACKNPRRGVWGGPPDGKERNFGAEPALGLAFVKRTKGALPRFIVRDVPEIGVKAYRKPKTAPKKR
jgi:hypothetical protein